MNYKDIVDVLKKKGPLESHQIAKELGVPVERVSRILSYHRGDIFSYGKDRKWRLYFSMTCRQHSKRIRELDKKVRTLMAAIRQIYLNTRDPDTVVQVLKRKELYNEVLG